MKNKIILKKYDLMFSGRIIDLKNPLFFAKVAAQVKKRIGHCSVLIIGDGDTKLKNEMIDIFQKNKVDYDFPGFITHNELPEFYSMAKILLLPTSGDCWGVVINEAMISGLPVITTDMTAAAGELVLNEINGYVLPFDEKEWTEKIVNLLERPKILNAFSDQAKETVNKFNFDSAAQGIIDAINFLANK
jgi:glycosyltransferase involved in cell wall biosynthesis